MRRSVREVQVLHKPGLNREKPANRNRNVTKRPRSINTTMQTIVHLESVDRFDRYSDVGKSV